MFGMLYVQVIEIRSLIFFMEGLRQYREREFSFD